ncbi:MAG: hypothetical protein MI924_38270 [Chloroflexales bacterium]|nr:hypothetical protein [Chloroflexales bacterium]
MHEIEQHVAEELARCTTPEAVRARGRQALATLQPAFAQVRTLPPDERRSAGQALNHTKAQIERLIDERLRALATESPVATVRPTPTMPVAPRRVGQVHPTVAVLRRIHAFFTALPHHTAAKRRTYAIVR